MALDFPATPAVGSRFVAPNGNTWQWDGAKWIAVPLVSGNYLPLAGGTLTGPLTLNANAAAALQPVTLQQLQTRPAINQPHIMGVTDGSAAAPGEIGESYYYNTGNFGMSGSSGSGIAMFTLPAGDWDLSGYCGTSPTGGTVLAWFAGSLQVGGSTYLQTTYAINQSITTSMPFATMRVSLTASAAVTSSWSAGFASGATCSCVLVAFARRVR